MPDRSIIRGGRRLIRAGVVGTGYVGENHARIYSELVAIGLNVEYLDYPLNHHDQIVELHDQIVELHDSSWVLKGRKMIEI